jgi:hypothetical protein
MFHKTLLGCVALVLVLVLTSKANAWYTYHYGPYGAGFHYGGYGGYRYGGYGYHYGGYHYGYGVGGYHYGYVRRW